MKKVVRKYGAKNWKKIASFLKERTDVQCLHRWQKVLNPSLVKGPWTKEEDDLVYTLVEKYGPQWKKIADEMQTRTRKQIRDRYLNILKQDIKVERWTKEEEEQFAFLHQKFGNRWAKIAQHLPGRTENQVKNKFYSSRRKS